MTSGTTRHTLVTGVGYYEGLCWRGTELWWSDFLSRRVFSLDAEGTSRERAYVSGQPSGIGFLPDGTPLVVSMMDHLLLRVGEPGHARVHANAGAHSVGPSNDLVVDAHGRAYVGSFGFEASYEDLTAVKPSSLLLIEPDGRVRPVADDLLFPNGMAISQDGRVLVVAETFANRLTAFDIAPDGSLHGRRIFADLGTRAPDGICMDVSGAVWAACPFAGEFVRVSEGGEILELVAVPGHWAVTVALGGRHRDTLFCATARTTLADFHAGRASASIESLRVQTPGY